MERPPIHGIEVFLTIVQEGSMRAAAKACNEGRDMRDVESQYNYDPVLTLVNLAILRLGDVRPRRKQQLESVRPSRKDKPHAASMFERSGGRYMHQLDKRRTREVHAINTDMRRDEEFDYISSEYDSGDNDNARFIDREDARDGMRDRQYAEMCALQVEKTALRTLSGYAVHVLQTNPCLFASPYSSDVAETITASDTF